MGNVDLVSQATAELYGTDLEAFTKRRTELAAQARAAGDRAAAKQIADLRKPTRSAWVVNQLVRADPSAPTQLAELAAAFKAGQAAADGTALRQLSRQRRTLLDTLIRQGFAIAGEDEPSATLREEVTSTLAAALTDEQVAAGLAAGTLTRAVQRSEFGALTGEPTQPALARDHVPAITTPAADSLPPAGAAAAEQTTNAERPASGTATEQAARAAAATRAALAEQQRQQAIARAEQTSRDAREAAEDAAAAERDAEQAVQRLEEQLAQARLRLQRARLLTRQATSAHQNATRALRRLQGPTVR